MLTSFLIIRLLLLLPLFFVHVTPAATYTFIYAGCSQQKYTPNNNPSPYESALNSFLASAVSSSQQSLYNNFADNSVPGSLYGLYNCRGDLNPSECSTCIQTAVTQISLICPYAYGAALQLEGCYIRYERYNFIGKPDTTLMYKRCISISSSSSSSKSLTSVDRVLGDLLLVGGGELGFRVSSSGSVHGFSQCLGDLSQSDCSACLVEAVKDLKSLCGSAAAARVFLAKCYVQYWEAGYYDFGPHASGAAPEDEVAKTIAIIVGIIAAVAILIVLLSLCRTSASGK